MDKTQQSAALQSALDSQLTSLACDRVVYLGPKDKARDGMPSEEPKYDWWFRPHHHRYAERNATRRARERARPEGDTAPEH